MLCESLRPVIRQFLDDLLDEKDHQEIHNHLRVCARCHAFASSVGTLSYQLYELGQVTVPPDIASTVSYQFAQKVPTAPTASVPVKEVTTGPSVLWTVLIVLTLMIVGISAFLFVSKKAPEKVRAVSSASTVAAVAPSDPTDLLAHWSTVNRHYHFSKSSQPELVALLGQMGVAIEHESASLVVFNVSKEKWTDFEGRFGALSGVIKEFGESQALGPADESVQVSIFLE